MRVGTGGFLGLPLCPSKGSRDNDFGKKLDSADPEGAAGSGWGAAQSILSGIRPDEGKKEDLPVGLGGPPGVGEVTVIGGLGGTEEAESDLVLQTSLSCRA